MRFVLHSKQNKNKNRKPSLNILSCHKGQEKSWLKFLKKAANVVIKFEKRREKVSLNLLLHTCAGFCVLMQASAYLCMLLHTFHIFAYLCMLLDDFAGFCRLLQAFAGFCRLLQAFAGFCVLVQALAHLWGLYCICVGLSVFMQAYLFMFWHTFSGFDTVSCILTYFLRFWNFSGLEISQVLTNFLIF